MTEHPNVTIGDDETSQAILQRTAIHSDAAQRVNDRLTTWEGAVEMELQELITTAASIRQQMNEAKTQTKRTYFNKKFKKVTNEVLQMVATLERLKQQRAAFEADRNPPAEQSDEQTTGV